MFFVVLAFIFFALTGCESYNNVQQKPSVEGSIVDNAGWYGDETNSTIDINIYIEKPNHLLCVPYDDLNAAARPCTLADIDNDIDAEDSYKPVLGVMMSANGYSGSDTMPNATLKTRGAYSRTAEQKSYSLKLNSKTELYLRQRKFQFIKSQSDKSRVKNKLAYDLFRTIPNITSLKTQFVHLFIDDIDYGLFTHVEAIRKEYLINRGWNKDDNLYNAANCFFEPRDELAVDGNGKPLNVEDFNTVLEIKNGENHSKVVEMIDAVNSSEDIDRVIDKYFNRDNYLTWLAINLVLNNKDTTYHNFYLYNPKYSSTFYFLPWDYDGAWTTTEYIGKNEYGISVWWESPLHKKFLSKKKNRDDLYAMAELLRKEYITDAAIRERLDAYEPTVRPFMSKIPDSEHNSDESWQKATNYLVTGIEENIRLYKSVIGDPMPFRQYADYNKSNGILSLSWDKSIDFEGDAIVYDLNLSKDSNFTNIVLEVTDINTTKYQQNIHLDDGIYYLKVISREENNSSHYQIAIDQVYENKTIYGVLRFEVK